MTEKALKGFVELAERVGHIFIATANSEGTPHVAAAGKVKLNPEGNVEIRAWFCPGTVSDLELNPRISLVVWDKDADIGYQLLGETHKILDIAVLDGYAPKIEEKMALPQVEKRLLVRADKVIEFKLAPHSDIEE